MKKRVKYLLSFVLLLAVLSPLSVSAKSGEAKFAVSSENGSDQNKATLSLAVEKGIAEDITSLRLQLLVEVTEGNMAAPAAGDEAKSKFEFSGNIGSEVKNWEVRKEGEKEYIIDLIISGTKSIFTEGKAEIGTLTLSALGKNDQFSAAVSLLPEQDPAGDSAIENGSEVVVDVENTDSEEEKFDTTPILEYVEDNGIQVEELRMTNADTVILSGGEIEPETTVQPETTPQPETPSQSETTAQSESDQTEAPSQSETTAQSESDQTETSSQSETTAQSESDQTETSSESESDQLPGTTTPSQPEGDSGDNASPQESETPPAVNPPTVVSPQETEKQTEAASPEETEKQTETAPPEEPKVFDKTTVSKLTLSRPLAGSAYVHFSWTEIEKADGYEIRQVVSGKNKLVATVKAEEGTEYEQAFEYGTQFKFKVRAFAQNDDGKKVYGKYSAVRTIKTPRKRLDQITGVAAKTETGSNKITISWENVKGAGGVRIYQLNEETGKFETIRTIDGTDASSYTVTRKLAETYTFRVAAYKYNKKGVPTYFGNYSEDAVITTSPARVNKNVTLTSNKKAQVDIAWKKVAKAEGYQIYRSTSKDGKYTRVKSRKASIRTYTDKKVKSGTTYYYKVRAYMTGHDGKRVYGLYSVPKAIKVK